MILSGVCLEREVACCIAHSYSWPETLPYLCPARMTCISTYVCMCEITVGSPGFVRGGERGGYKWSDLLGQPGLMRVEGVEAIRR